MARTRIWRRPKHVPGGGDAHVSIVVFTTAEVTGLTASRSKHGVPEDATRFAVRMDDYERSEAPQRFAELHSPGIMALADDEGIDVDALRQAPHQIAIELTVSDPEDAEHLRLAWGFARAICDSVGVLGILDRYAHRWWTPERLSEVPPSAGFDPRREVSVLFEMEPSPGYGHVCHTRGLRKLGRPDLILTDLTLRHADLAGQVLIDLASHLALGAIVEPGDHLTLRLGSGPVSAYVPGGNAPELHLNNRGLVLSSEGRHQPE